MAEARRRIVLAAAASLLLAGCTGATLDDAATATTTAPAVPPGAYRLDDHLSHVLAPGPYAPLAPELVELNSEADGARLAFVIVRPDVPDGVRVPVIVEASPYYTDGTTARGVLDEFYYKRYVENFLPHGYAVAFIPVRGTADQGGCSDVHGPLERADLSQAVTWLGTQAWSNGNVGMIGLSYAGATAWEVAATGNPHLKTIVPIGGVNDMHDLMFRNGSMEDRGPIGRYMTSYYRTGTVGNTPATGDRSAGRVIEAAICPETLRGMAASAHAALEPGSDPVGFWAARDQRPGVEERYRGSVLLIQGLRDWNVDPAHNVPWVGSLESRGVVVHQMLGQWGHRFPDRTDDADDVERLTTGDTPTPFELRRMDLSEKLLRWFDRWLKEDASVALGPRVEVQDSALGWRTEDAWPPADATTLTLHLAAGGRLTVEADTPSGRALVGPAPFKHDPLATERPAFDPACVLCAVFVSEPFEDGLRVAGFPRVPLTVVPTAPAGHVAAWLYVMDDAGRTLEGWGQIDLRFAAGDGTPRPVAAGQPLVARLELEPVDLVVPPGARLALLLHQGSYGDHMMSLPTAPLHLEVGGDASRLELPVVSRDGSTAFLPPGVAP